MCLVCPARPACPELRRRELIEGSHVEGPALPALSSVEGSFVEGPEFPIREAASPGSSGTDSDLTAVDAEVRGGNDIFVVSSF